MQSAERAAKYKELHQKLDELVAAYLDDTGRRPTSASVMELLEWSAQRVMDTETAEQSQKDKAAINGIIKNSKK